MMISPSLPSMAPVYPQPKASAGADRETEANQSPPAENKPSSRSDDEEKEAGNRSSSQPSGTDSTQGLDKAELKELTDLKSRDREVRAHEAAHQSVGGQYAGAISYVYERGPDGAQYAVGGEVSIDTSPIQGDPQATIEKMRVVRSAALAPAEPSPQDRAVAAQAMQIMLQAQSELSLELGAPGASRDAANAYRSVSDIEASNTEEDASSFRATA